MLSRKWIAGAPVALLPVALAACAQGTLLEGFKSPPDVARPRVYWYWQNGNITKDGLTKDLEWMKRAGIAGVETFDVAVDTPTVVNPRLAFMTPGWKDAFKHSLEVADGLGIKVTIGAAPGWSQTGGPWVAPQEAMKKFVWSKTIVVGGKPVSIVLPKPPSISGPFQDQPLATRPDRPVPKLGELYKDQTVFAYPAPKAEVVQNHLPARITSSGGSFTYHDLASGSVAHAGELPAESGKVSWIAFEFGTPQTIRGVTVGTVGSGNGFPEAIPPAHIIEISDDGNRWRRIVDLPVTALYQSTVAFEPVTTRFLRYSLPATSNTPFLVSEFKPLLAMPVHRFEEKDAFAGVLDYYTLASPKADEESVVPMGKVIDLTAKMKEDGTLDWTPPAGDWVIVRMGYSLEGTTNHPAPLEETGFEVDKLNKGYTKAFMDKYLALYQDASGGMMGQHGVNYVATDSWEAGFANWTDGMLSQFKRLRGYDPTPFLPVLTGQIVGSSEASDRFLWDFRKTISRLVTTENFETVRDSLHAHGLGYVTEAMAGRRATIGDTMEMKARSDFPMGEMWQLHPTPERNMVGRNYFPDLTDTASVANVYGKPLATAESLTSATTQLWGYGPWDLKTTADLEFLGGINQFTMHVSVHEPNDYIGPGLTLGRNGQFTNRLETWAEQYRAWTDYIARSSYLMQQGRAVVDVAYFYGEEGPTIAVNEGHAPVIPEGHLYDWVNSEILLNELSVKDGKIVAKSGMSYRLLNLGGTSQYMTLPVLRQIAAFVKAGAVVVGTRPLGSPSNADDGKEWDSLVKELWPDSGTVRKVGAGRMYQVSDLSLVFDEEHIRPDFSYVQPEPDSRILYYHRVTSTADIYFVNNRNSNLEIFNATFRVTGKTPEIWMADTGTHRPVSYTMHDGVTTIPLRMLPRDAMFIVFDKPATEMARVIPDPIPTQVTELAGQWQVAFQPDHGGPGVATFPELTDWTESTDPGIKYYSGTAIYTKTFNLPASAIESGSQLEIDLGSVHEIAEVAVNGKTAGIAWKPPYKVDITAAAKAGENTVQIKIVNLWPNRLIGDQQPGAKKIAFAPNSLYKSNSPLFPSGLMGPVVVNKITAVEPGTLPE